MKRTKVCPKCGLNMEWVDEIEGFCLGIASRWECKCGYQDHKI